MASSSYQILARYNNGRHSNRMSDIRQQLREDIFFTRIETKQAQLFKNRRLVDTSSHDCDDADSYYSEDLDEPDYYSSSTGFPDEYPSSWISSPSVCHSPSQICQSDTPSPSLSNDSDFFSANSTTGYDHCDSIRSKPLEKSDSRINLRSRRQILNLRKSVQKSCYSIESVRLEYYTLKQHIVKGSTDQATIGFILCSGWNALANAINSLDEYLARDSLNFLTQLIVNRLVRITDILFIFQQGLILTIKDTISRLGSQQADVVALLMSIIFIEPRAASYMIELMIDTDIVRLLEEFIEFGTDGEALLTTKFYSCLFDVEFEMLHMENYTPVVPDTLSRTISPTELVKAYCPALSLKRIIRPSLITSLICRFYKTNSEIATESFRMATVITANCLKLVYINSCSQTRDASWIYSVMSEFELARFDQLIEKLVHNLNRNPTKTSDILRWISTFYCEITGAISFQLPL